MKVVILCGGKGERMGEISSLMPKPLIPIGGRPVLWHIMKKFSVHGFNDFVLCLGYRGEQIRDYFRYNSHEWNIEFVDTGIDAQKSERLVKIKDRLDSEDFFLCYGDDLSDVDVTKILETHRKSGKIVTLTAIRLASPFGMIEMDSNGNVIDFKEKPVLDHWINGGYMVVNNRIFDYLHEGELETQVFTKLAKDKSIDAYKHFGIWKSMTTLKDNTDLNNMWSNGTAFWKNWDD